MSLVNVPGEGQERPLIFGLYDVPNIRQYIIPIRSDHRHKAIIAYFRSATYHQPFRRKPESRGLSFIYGRITTNWYKTRHALVLTGWPYLRHQGSII